MIVCDDCADLLKDNKTLSRLFFRGRRASRKASENISETFSDAGGELPAGSKKRKKAKKRSDPLQPIIEEFDDE